MMAVLVSFLLTLRTATRSRAELQFELLALRHQLQVLQRTQPRRLRLTKADRWLWIGLAHLDGMADGARHRQAGDRHRLAPMGLPALVDLEGPAPPGATDRASRRPHTDSHNVAGESALGRATDSWRTPETRARRL